MTKILFIETPPTVEWIETSKISKAGRRHPCLNETGEQTYSYQNLSAAAVLRNNEYDVQYFHCPTLRWNLEKTKSEILKFAPSYLVIMLEHITQNVAEILSKFSKENSIKVIWVGPFVTALHENEIKKTDTLDFILRKEWDYSLLELINTDIKKGDLSKVKGLTWINQDKPLVNPDTEFIHDLDALPIPAYDLVNMDKFYESVFVRFPAATMISSRGCPNFCVFCSYPQTIYSRKYRSMSPSRVLKEVKYLVEKLGVKEIRFDDDTFIIDEQRAIDICKLIYEAKLDLIYSIQARADLMTNELAKWLKKSGCRMILFGIESGNEEVLKHIKKRETKEQMVKGVRIAQKYGIDVLNSIMLGFYWDTKETVEETIQFAFRLNAEFTQMSVPTPLPGTEYYDLLDKENCFISKEWHKHDSVHHSNVVLPNLSNEDLNTFLGQFYRRYYRRPKYLWMMFIRSFRSFDNFKQSMRKFNVLFTK